MLVHTTEVCYRATLVDQINNANERIFIFRIYYTTTLDNTISRDEHAKTRGLGWACYRATLAGISNTTRSRYRATLADTSNTTMYARASNASKSPIR